ncbi:hypothetical protein HK097_010260 [Rhizophlyctis rosea]|uniref:Uncharacterized protein n=1 Tax=Rhizophlyctis rosea TaxID=64517 RepID=A0AAD5X3Y7_9FUNG|nr:hypothetical protein HK097_010260 [Rhizophlyctis rosea]
MGTRPDDWQTVIDAAAKWPDRVVPSFGIHPWFAHTIPSTTSSTQPYTTLETHLTTHPTATIGEIGIDSIAKDRTTNEKYPFDHQFAIFKHQMDLAGRLGRPVNVHVVQCHGVLLEYFAELAGKGKSKKSAKNKSQSVDATPPPTAPKITPTILLHSFSGSPQMITSLLSLPVPFSRRIFFSFSHAINTRSAKFADRIKAVPDDRILIESDLHDASLVDRAMWEGLKMVAGVKGWTLEECVERVKGNVEEYLRFGREGGVSRQG